jgi:hypothetical protein
MSASAISGRSASSLEEITDACKIVVLCEDSAARDRAVELFNRISASFSGDLSFAITCWNYGELAEQSSGQSASEAAALADIIMFSTRSSDLPSAVGNWLDGIAHPKGKSEGALAFMLTDPDNPTAPAAKMITQLTEAARRLDMDFIPLMPAAPAVQKVESDTKMPEWIVTASKRDSFDRPTYDHWGLNE